MEAFFARLASADLETYSNVFTGKNDKINSVYLNALAV